MSSPSDRRRHPARSGELDRFRSPIGLGLTEHQRRAIPTFSALRAFEAVGTCGGIRKAAVALSVDHAAISRHLRALERWLGVPLIDRTPNSGADMTEAGQLLYESVARAFREIATSSLELMRVNEGHLTVWCEPALASEWLASRLCDFTRQHPDIEVSLKPIDLTPNFTPDFPDVQIHCLSAGVKLKLDPVFCSTIIAQPTEIVVSGSEFAASSIDVRTARDLLNYRLLHEGSSERWRFWFRARGVPVEELPGPRFWHGHLVLAAARRNQGLALTNRLLASEGLSNGELIEVQAWQETRCESYHFTTLESAWSRGAVSKFRAWLRGAARGVPAR